MPRYRRIIGLSALLGIPIGLFGALFYLVWHELHNLIWERLPQPIHRVWVSALAGLLIGLTIRKLWDPGSMSDLISHFHHKGKLPPEDNKPIIPISLIGLVGGSSAGPEGVLTQVCGSMGSWLAARAQEPGLTRILTQAGMGAGFGAFLGSPVGGAILWLEMPHRQGLEYYESLVPTLTTSAVGYLLMALLLRTHLTATWVLPAYTPSTLSDVLFALGMGIVGGATALIYSRIFRLAGESFAALPGPPCVTTTLAGLLIGLLGWVVPISYFYGSHEMLELIGGSFSLYALAVILFAKMLAASITIRGHWQGGLIIPHMFMGATLGKMAALLVPGINPTLAMLTGMAAFNAAATHTPLASALIVLSLTDFGGSIPIFMASLTGFFIGQRVDLIGNKQHRVEPASVLAGYTVGPPGDGTGG
jgi:H+/Cl- antiporter ClcA